MMWKESAMDHFITRIYIEKLRHLENIDIHMNTNKKQLLNSVELAGQLG